MTDDQKPDPSKRVPRRRNRAKTHAGSADAAKRNSDRTRTGDAGKRVPGQPAAGVPAAAGTRPGDADRPRVAPTAPTRALAVVPVHVRWRDLDAFNHVNNAAYLTFLEEARLQWLRQVPGEWFGEHAMPVMASVEMHYRKPVNWPAEIDVHLTCERLGNSSITVGHRIAERSDAACVHADGRVVLVWIDPATGNPVPLPDAIRAAVA